MGDKGAKYPEDVGEFAEELMDVLFPVGEISWRKMFGGAGLFVGESMFALIDSSAQLHLEVDDTNRVDFEQAGAAKHARMPYYAVPSEVLTDDVVLVGWARASAAIASQS